MFYKRSRPHDDERDLFQRVDSWRKNSDQAAQPIQYDAAYFQTLTASEGIDFATAVLFHRLVHHPRYALAVTQIQDLQKQELSFSLTRDAIVAVVPGAFYQEHPETGADGQVIRETAARMGFQAELIPVLSVGSPARNARLICDWLKQQAEVPVILASLSKGGMDVKLALKEPDAAACFQHVIAWLNVGGILNGSPMVKWLFGRKFRTLLYRMIFRLRGQNFDVVRALHPQSDGMHGVPLDVPAHCQCIHVAGFPLRRHVSSPRAARWHRRLSCWGPNDSVMLLTELEKLPGMVFPVWGTDHYLQSRWDASQLVRSLLYFLGTEQNLIRSL